jgi:hypothetical protein
MVRHLTEPETVMFQQVALPVIGAGTDGSFRPLGPCWILCINGRDELA